MFRNLYIENLVVYEIMWKNILKPGRPRVTIWRIGTPCRITEATNTDSECVILIAFPRQQWFARTRLNVTLCVHCLSCLSYKWIFIAMLSSMERIFL